MALKKNCSLPIHILLGLDGIKDTSGEEGLRKVQKNAMNKRVLI